MSDAPRRIHVSVITDGRSRSLGEPLVDLLRKSTFGAANMDLPAAGEPDESSEATRLAAATAFGGGGIAVLVSSSGSGLGMLLNKEAEARVATCLDEAMAIEAVAELDANGCEVSATMPFDRIGSIALAFVRAVARVR